jgi:hypothetical protein
MMKNLKKRANSRDDRFPKTLFTLSRCRIAEDDGSRDLLSQSQMHVDERDEVVLVAQQRRRQKTRCVGDSWSSVVASSMAAARIYRDLLGLSLSKRIRYRLIVKINGKRRLWAYEALSQILMDYSHARHALAPIASPRLIMPRSAW